MGFWDSSGMDWTICKQSAPHSRQTTTPTPHHSLTPNQQCQSTEGTNPLNENDNPSPPYVVIPLWKRSVVIIVSVCLSFREHTVSLESLVRTSLNLLCRLPIAIARTLSGGVAIRYVYFRFCGRALKA